jgi:hypothetical protein
VSAGHLLPEETAVTLTECYWETLLALWRCRCLNQRFTNLFD